MKETTDTHEKIKQIMAKIFKVDPSQITEDSTPENIDNWDSLNHINLILALESEFNLKFAEDDILNMTGYKIIVELIQERLKG